MLVSNLASVNWFKSKPPREPALIFLKTDGTQVIYSWEDYKQNSILAACALKHCGVKENDFVAVVSTLCIDKNDKDLIVKDLSNLFPQMNYFLALKNKKITTALVKDFVQNIREINQ